jgi:hypothetical protein
VKPTHTLPAAVAAAATAPYLLTMLLMLLLLLLLQLLLLLREMNVLLLLCSVRIDFEYSSLNSCIFSSFCHALRSLSLSTFLLGARRPLNGVVYQQQQQQQQQQQKQQSSLELPLSSEASSSSGTGNTKAKATEKAKAECSYLGSVIQTARQSGWVFENPGQWASQAASQSTDAR